MSLFYIDICIPSSVNEGYFVDTQFCTHDLIKENDLDDHPCTSKIIIALHASLCSCINMHQLVFELHALIHSLHIIKMILRF